MNPPRTTSRVWGGAALAAIIIAAWFLGARLTGVWSSLSTRGPDASIDSADTARQVAVRDGRIVGDVEQFTGRSLFVIPPRPIPPPDPIANRPVETAPPPPSRYGGPSLVAMVHDTAWFSDGTRLTPGEEEGGVWLVSTNPPWGARVSWRGVEFDVTLFNRDRVVITPESTNEPDAASSDLPQDADS